MRRAFLIFAAILTSVLAEVNLVSRRLGVTSRLGRRGLAASDAFNITIVHVNDVHAHLDEYGPRGDICGRNSTDCVGGYARLKTKIDEIRASTDRSLALNMGDEFQGTLFFSYYHGAEKIAEVVNSIGFDAITIGNHEFDKGNAHLADYLSNLTVPVISANIVTNNTRLMAQIKPYHIIPEYSIALVGITTNDTATSSRPDPGTEFLDPATILQNTVDHINKHERVDRIIAMTHIGYDEDLDLARRTRGVHLILGGHSHTLLGDKEQFTDVKGDFKIEGEYPTIVHNLDGEEVFVVTAWRWGRVLGHIDVAFEAGSSGRVLACSGKPILMDHDTKQDPELQAKVDAWKQPFEEYVTNVIGVTEADLSGENCKEVECTLGNFITDAMVDYRLEMDTKVDGAIINGGAIRQSIPTGNITRAQVIESFPFGNTIVDVDFSGAELRKLFDGIANKRNTAQAKIKSIVQVSRNITVVFAPERPIGHRLKSLTISGKPVDDTKIYKIVTNDYVAGGGSGFIYPLQPTGPPGENLEVVMSKYIKKKKDFTPKLGHRIQKSEVSHIELYNGGEGRQLLFGDRSCLGTSCLRED